MNKTDTLIYVTDKDHWNLLIEAVNSILISFPKVQNWIVEKRSYDLVVLIWYNVCPTLPIKEVEEIKEKFSFYISGFMAGCDRMEIVNG